MMARPAPVSVRGSCPRACDDGPFTADGWFTCASAGSDTFVEGMYTDWPRNVARY
jgi:hypothetical protein